MEGRSAGYFTYSRSELFWLSDRPSDVVYITDVERVETVVGVRVILQDDNANQPSQNPNENLKYLATAGTTVATEALLTLCDDNKIPRVQDLPLNRAAWVSIAKVSNLQRSPLVPLKLQPFRCNLGASYVKRLPGGTFKNIGIEFFYL